jgi:MtN3 and saliva related transmembrane protein
MDYITLVGFIAAFLTTTATLPQLIKTIKTKRAGDISVLMYIIMSSGIFLWMIYGFLIMDYPIILANSMTFVFSFSLLLLKIRYG